MMIEAIVDAKYYWDNRYYEKVGSEVKDITDDLPFEIPDRWVWTRFSTLIQIISGVSYDKKDVATKGIRILRGGNINDLKVSLFSDDVFLPETYYDPDKQIQIDDVLIVASTGSKEVIGKAGYVIEPLVNTQIGAFLRIVRPILKWYAPYVKLIFATEYYREHIRHLSGGTNINNIKADYINALIISLPPYAEQIRIAERINSLFEQINIIEQSQTDTDTLYKEFIKRTLTLAIQGKLVPQDPNDEPANVLLERIRAEKKAKLGKKYVDSYIYKSDDNCYYEHIAGREQDELVEVPFDIPDNWAWSRIDGVAFLQSGKPFEELESGTPYVKVSDMNLSENNIEITTSQHYCKATSRDIIPASSIIFPKRGGAISTNKKRKVLSFYCCIDLNTMCMTPFLSQMLEYLFSWFLTIDLGMMHDGTSVPQINNVDIYPLLVPIPPLADQKRIVAKINEIFTMLLSQFPSEVRGDCFTM